MHAAELPGGDLLLQSTLEEIKPVHDQRTYTWYGRMSVLGDLLWSKVIPSVERYVWMNRLLEVGDGQWLTAGRTFERGGSIMSARMHMVDESATVHWTRDFPPVPGKGNTRIGSVALTSDGGLFIVGTVHYPAEASKPLHLWIRKLPPTSRSPSRLATSADQ
jgi:hypothetical protein